MLRLVAVAFVWLAPPVVCLFKGKVGMGLLGLVGPVVASVVAFSSALVFFLVNDEGPSTGWEDLGLFVVALLVGLAMFVGLVATSLLVSTIGAIRLAKPDSVWARRYDEDKLAASRVRFEVTGQP